jgi:hypothetical protein
MTRRKKPNEAKRKRRRRPVIKGELERESRRAAKTETQSDDLLLNTDDELDDLDAAVPMWMDQQGLHALLPGSPEANTYERLTEQYQQSIRNSPMWDEMVREFGLQKAEQLLKQCRAKPG